MARVAICPQCEHELLVPDEAAAGGLAKCPACKSFFELGHAESRELPTVLLVDSKVAASSSQTAPTVSELPPLAKAAKELPPEPQAPEEEELQLESHELEPSGQESPEAAAQRIDQWFRSARTLSDLPQSKFSPADEEEEDPGEPVDMSAGSRTIDVGDVHAAGGFDADFELEQPAETPHDAAAWDDPQDMERLLAGIESQPVHSLEASGHQTLSDMHEDHTQVADEWSPEVSLPITPGRGEPRRKRSLVRTLFVSAVGGLVGLGLGYYALLWLRGPEIDFLELAKYLPKSALPASFRSEVKKSAVSPAPSMISDLAAGDKGNEPAPQTAEAPAEKQAAFTSPAEPAKSVNTPDDRYAIPAAKTESHEPAMLDVPPAKALAESTSSNAPVRIANAPSFTADELSASLEAAKDARPGLVNGDLSDGKEVANGKGRSYMVMADLALKATFVETAATPADASTMSQQIEMLFRQTLANAHTRNEVAQIVPKWIASPNRKHGGVFFAGSVTLQQSKGAVVECSVELGGGQSLVVLVPPAAAQQIGDSSQPVGVVGWIVDKPAAQIQDYTGTAPQAVFANQLIHLE